MEARRVARERGGAAVAGCNALIKTTLSGPVDRDPFEVVWHAAQEQFSAIPYAANSST